MPGKISDYTFSNELRKQTELMDFLSDVRNIINSFMTGVVAKVESTGQTGDIATTTIYTPTTAWAFRISIYMICTTAGTGTLSCTIGWQDASGAKTLSPAGTVDLSNTANGSTGTAFIRANASAITYATAIAGKAGSPEYTIHIILEQMG